MTPLTEDWLRQCGFRWHEMERCPNKHWVLWLGGAIEDGVTSYEDLGIELTLGRDDGWYCWIRADYAGRYSRCVHVRTIRFQEEVCRLIEGLTGLDFDPANVMYGVLRTAKAAARLREDDESLHKRIARSWGKAACADLGKPFDESKDELIRP